MMTLHLSCIQNKKCGLKKYVIVISKIKLKKNHHEMKEFKSKMHDFFPNIKNYDFWNFQI
jgi:hypothetical protein